MGVSCQPSSIGHVMLARAVCSAVLSLDSLSRSVADDSSPPLIMATRWQMEEGRGLAKLFVFRHFFPLRLALVVPSFPPFSTPNRP